MGKVGSTCLMEYAFPFSSLESFVRAFLLFQHVVSQNFCPFKLIHNGFCIELILDLVYMYTRVSILNILNFLCLAAKTNYLSLFCLVLNYLSKKMNLCFVSEKGLNEF